MLKVHNLGFECLPRSKECHLLLYFMLEAVLTPVRAMHALTSSPALRQALEVLWRRGIVKHPNGHEPSQL